MDEVVGSISVQRDNIPQYLHDSDFYVSINGSDESAFTVPRNCLKVDCTINSTEDLRCLLSTTRFWGMRTIPGKLIAYALNTDTAVYKDVFAEYEAELRFLSVLKSMKVANSHRARWESVMTSGELDIVKYMHKHGYAWCPEALYKAAAHGHLHLLQYAQDHGCLLSAATHGQICTAAIKNNHQGCLEYMFQQPLQTRQCDLCSVAANARNLDALQFLYKHDCPWTTVTCSSAAQSGSLECLKYARQNGCPWDSYAFRYAVQPYKPEIVVYLHENGCPWDARSLFYAIEGGNEDCVQYLLSHGCPADTACLNAAASRGNYEYTKILLERGVQVQNWDELEDDFGDEDIPTAEAAAKGGNVQCLELVVQHGALMTREVCGIAVQQNSVACLKFAHEHGCKIGAEGLFRIAVKHGHLDCIQYLTEHKFTCTAQVLALAVTPSLYKPQVFAYLHEHGCPLDERVLHAAVEGHNTVCVDYLLTHGCPADTACVNALAQNGDVVPLQLVLDRPTPVNLQTAAFAARSGNLQCLQLVIRHGAPWSTTVCANAVEKNDLVTLQFAHENGCPWQADMLCATAAKHGSLNCLKYLVEQGCPMYSDVTAEAAGNGHLECLKYAHEHSCPWDHNTCHRAAKGLHFTCLFYAHAEGCPLNPVDVKPSGPK